MKKLITLALCGALLAIPVQAEDPPPENLGLIGGCIIAVLVIGTGIVVVAGLHKMCKALPPLQTNSVPTNAIPTNLPPGIKTNLPRRAMVMPTPGIIQPTVTVLGRESFTAEWCADYRFEMRLLEEGTNITLSVEAFNASGALVGSNTFSTFESAGERYAYCDFSHLPLQSTPSRYFRLMSLEAQ